MTNVSSWQGRVSNLLLNFEASGKDLQGILAITKFLLKVFHFYSSIFEEATTERQRFFFLFSWSMCNGSVLSTCIVSTLALFFVSVLVGWICYSKYRTYLGEPEHTENAKSTSCFTPKSSFSSCLPVFYSCKPASLHTIIISSYTLMNTFAYWP